MGDRTNRRDLSDRVPAATDHHTQKGAATPRPPGPFSPDTVARPAAQPETSAARLTQVRTPTARPAPSGQHVGSAVRLGGKLSAGGSPTRPTSGVGAGPATALRPAPRIRPPTWAKIRDLSDRRPPTRPGRSQKSRARNPRPMNFSGGPGFPIGPRSQKSCPQSPTSGRPGPLSPCATPGDGPAHIWGWNCGQLGRSVDRTEQPRSCPRGPRVVHRSPGVLAHTPAIT